MTQENLSLGFQTRLDTNWSVEPLKRATPLEPSVYKEEQDSVLFL